MKTSWPVEGTSFLFSRTMYLFKKMTSAHRQAVEQGKLLWTASYQGQTEEVAQILGTTPAEFDVNWQDSEHARSPFLRSCFFGHVEIVKLFLADPRTDVNRRQTQGASPFYIACQQGHVEVVKLLLREPRVEVNLAAYDDMTPIYSACQNGHLEVVRWILALSQVEVDITTNPSFFQATTPQGIAVANGHSLVAALVGSYTENPAKTRTQLRIDLGITSMAPCSPLHPHLRPGS